MATGQNDLTPLFVSLGLSSGPQRQGIFAILALLKQKGIFENADINLVCKLMAGAVADVDGIDPALADDERQLIEERRKVLTGDE